MFMSTSRQTFSIIPQCCLRLRLRHYPRGTPPWPRSASNGLLITSFHQRRQRRHYTTTVRWSMPCRPAISSQSLGRAWEHALFPKLKAASEAGFEGVEIFFEDLAHLANIYTQERLEDHGA